ncbi:FeoB-associated Cys-rich membrane protein [Cetobacterium sp. SF1]
MKTIILLIIVIIIAYFGLKSVFKMFTGKGGCSCGSDKKGSCQFKDKCHK